MRYTQVDDENIYIRSAFNDENDEIYYVPVCKKTLETKVKNGASLKNLADFWGVHYSTFCDNPHIRKIVNPAKANYRETLKERANRMSEEGSERLTIYLLDRVAKWDDERDTETADESNAPQPLIFAEPVYDIDSIPEHIKEQIRKEGK